MSKLTNVEKHYILTSGKSIKEMAKDLGRAQKTVKKYYDENIQEQEEQPEQPENLSNPAEELKGQSTYDAKTGLAKKNGVVIMTKAGAEKGDLVKKRSKKQQRSDCIHKI